MLGLLMMLACSVETEGETLEECLDSIDNDENGLTDCDDGGCMAWDHCDPSDGGGPGGPGPGGDDTDAPTGADTDAPTGADDTDTTDDTGPGDSDDADWRTLCINEFMVSNSNGYQDESGAYPDWVELHNAGPAALELAGGTITDDLDEPDKHTLGALTIEAGGFLVLFADGDTGDGDLHLSFSLAASGESLALYAPGGERIDALNYPEQAENTAALRVTDCGEQWSYTTSPTPGESNE